MQFAFAIIAALTVVSAIAAMSFRNLIHCALSLMLTLTGLACFYLQLHAEFVGLVQVLVYIGAVAILIVFAILLTRNSTGAANVVNVSPSWAAGIGVAVLVLGTLLVAIFHSTTLARPPMPPPEMTAREIGDQLMTQYVLPLEIVALLLTAALIGAIIIAMQEKKHQAHDPHLRKPRAETHALVETP